MKLAFLVSLLLSSLAHISLTLKDEQSGKSSIDSLFSYRLLDSAVCYGLGSGKEVLFFFFYSWKARSND